ncbi:MAG: glutathione peroxidase [Ignavibacteriaceae bacterium]|nr:glutathione peroxidase [Ignavibacteriaceae bacterium]
MKTKFPLIVFSSVIFLMVLMAFMLPSEGYTSDNYRNPNIDNQTDGAKNMTSNIKNISVKDIDGNTVKLSEYSGKVLLIVNVASYCGYTPQYDGLEELYNIYKDRGFEVLAFPCNDFGRQEPGTNEEIKAFCSTKYKISFRLFDKVKVLGDDKHPLYKILSDNPVTGTSDIGWNFEKFLIDKEGNVVKRYKSGVAPLDAKLTGDIDALIFKN